MPWKPSDISPRSSLVTGEVYPSTMTGLPKEKVDLNLGLLAGIRTCPQVPDCTNTNICPSNLAILHIRGR